MNNFERVLKILQEQSFNSIRNSIYISNMLFGDNHTIAIEKTINQYFPINDDTDRTTIYNVISIIENITGIKYQQYINESNFPSSDDMLLSILNKYFSTIDKTKMRSFLTTQFNNKISTDAQILFLWTKFNARFAIKPKSDVV